MSATDLYQQVVLEHNRNPRNFRALTHATHRAEGVNVLCGDQLELYLQVCEERIHAAGFTGQMSAITTAAASMMTELVTGLLVREALTLKEAALELLLAPQAQPSAELGAFNALFAVRAYPSRIKTATLPWATLAAALRGQAQTTTEGSERGI